MNIGIKIMALGILCVVVASYLDTSGIVGHDYEFFLVIVGVILGAVGLFMKDT
ncbi:hypothetical protein [Paenibacillus sp. V4I7]|uniref:hypothetical protein n=1 Tax=Paenibacillus sp. V4I7 TaxID=3042307 RepID=UPI0027867CD9|nr:hypothetical protein [Paenibacillus sp. V4I7]MDQ0897568.1 uncharacterized membrane protein YgaE (UPF0421/DUF939 family) [Paenibacillus sp. V4I7]MDQ0916425.1 uncharacterized membrane protein YgaE (UPF0421/DUF939 family) [Paenibacillus sp. V4I5]